MFRYAVKINISKHAQSWDSRVDFFKSDVFMKTHFFFVAQICDFQKCEKMIISLLSVEFHLKVTGSDEASKIPDSFTEARSEGLIELKLVRKPPKVSRGCRGRSSWTRRNQGPRFLRSFQL